MQFYWGIRIIAMHKEKKNFFLRMNLISIPGDAAFSSDDSLASLWHAQLTTLRDLRHTLLEEWENIPQENIRTSVDSMPTMATAWQPKRMGAKWVA